MIAIFESDTMTLQVTDAIKHYDSNFALSDVTFDLPEGYIMGLIGPNGAGKSTLIKFVLNMIHRDAGPVHVPGFDNIANEGLVEEQFGVVFGFSYIHELWQVKSIERIVAPLYPSWDGGCYREYLDISDFGDVQSDKKHIKDLSRGMQMKLILVIALSHDAKSPILDGPASGLDVFACDRLMDILYVCIEDGEHSVLFSTHITADLERTAGFTTYITNGRLYYTGLRNEFEESFRLVKGDPDELAQSPADVVLGSHTHATGFDTLVRPDRLDAVASAVPGLVVESASIDDIIRLTNAHNSNRDLNGR